MTFDRSKHTIRREVEKLASELLDGQQGPQQRERLEALLVTDPKASDFFVDCMALQALLEARHEGKPNSTANSDFEQLACDLIGEQCLGELKPGTQESSEHSPPNTWRNQFIPVYLKLALAACLLITGSAGLWLFSQISSSVSDSSRYVGVLSQAVGARWASEDSPKEVPARLIAGQRLKLEAGYAEMTLNSGCTCAMQGPAEVELISPMCLRAIKGALWARVGEEAIGFVIETPTAKVVDLGTEFGVNVDSAKSATDVVVFEGAVDLHVAPARSGSNDQGRKNGSLSSTRLNSGEGMRIEQSGIARRIIAFSSEQYPRSARSPAAQYRPALIGGISDNIRDLNSTKYYQIVHAGLYDDTRAYVDRKHEWNGVDENGIPPVLRGADYVMCFNNDKWNAELEITVDVVAPARLFVFFDDRLPVPQWLVANFEATAYKIGVDEGYAKQHPAPQSTAYGAGKSIDTVYSIWQTDINQPGTVQLGALPKSAIEVSMYGIAAVPLEESAEAHPAVSETL